MLDNIPLVSRVIINKQHSPTALNLFVKWGDPRQIRVDILGAALAWRWRMRLKIKVQCGFIHYPASPSPINRSSLVHPENIMIRIFASKRSIFFPPPSSSIITRISAHPFDKHANPVRCCTTPTPFLDPELLRNLTM